MTQPGPAMDPASATPDAASFERARTGLGNRGVPLWRHTCGHVEAFPEAQLAEIGGGCDACESGSPNTSDWQPLFVAIAEDPAPTTGAPFEDDLPAGCVCYYREDIDWGDVRTQPEGGCTVHRHGYLGGETA